MGHAVLFPIRLHLVKPIHGFDFLITIFACILEFLFRNSVFFLLSNLFDLVFECSDLFRHIDISDMDSCTSLVKRIDSLVGQVTIRHITVG